VIGVHVNSLVIFLFLLRRDPFLIYAIIYEIYHFWYNHSVDLFDFISLLEAMQYLNLAFHLSKSKNITNFNECDIIGVGS
jgi:hypothetical protein